MKIAVIREDKTPPDSRVPLTPSQVKMLRDRGYEIEVQRSSNRCYKDEEYEELGIPMIDVIEGHDFLLGVKEVPVDNILEGKTYFMFSHTIKEQAYNRKLLQTIISKKCTLVDYEVLTNKNGARVIAFGKFAGMVGAHNGVYTFGKRTGRFELPRLKDLPNYKAATALYKSIDFPKMKIVLTGTGRVSGGAAKVLYDMGFEKVSPLSFIKDDFDRPVFCQLNSFFYVKRKDGKTFDSAQDFYENPQDYESDFHHFLPQTDILINGIYWDTKAPAFFTREQMQEKSFAIKVIADVTCDIAPDSSIPATIKASTIADPIFGFNPKTGKEENPHQKHVIDMMTIDNLPNELPRDASEAFGEMFINNILSPLENGDQQIIDEGTIVKNGQLQAKFEYLRHYVSI